ncbi:phosphoribosyl transferase [Candidatus Woesearchaeota archaeon]|nr:phosphoribosyl transferase [Candidatus Woesearchaeota archaeon]
MFKNRADAGRKLAKQLKAGKRTVVLGLPRGGVVTAAEVAKALKVPLDIIVTKKLGYPRDPEYGIGAVGLKTDVIDRAGVDPAYIKREIAQLRKQVKERYQNLRGKRKMPALAGKMVIIVDDGMATGASMEAAVKEVATQKPAKVIVAVPVAHPDAVRRIERIAEVICLEQPWRFLAVGEFYEDFREVTEEDVKKFLKKPL